MCLCLVWGQPSGFRRLHRGADDKRPLVASNPVHAITYHETTNSITFTVAEAAGWTSTQRRLMGCPPPQEPSKPQEHMLSALMQGITNYDNWYRIFGSLGMNYGAERATGG